MKTEETELASTEPEPPFWFQFFLRIKAQIEAKDRPFGNIRFSIGEVEQALALKRDQQPQQFGACIACINRKLAVMGMNLSEHGHHQEYFRILDEKATMRRAIGNRRKRAKRELMLAIVTAIGLAGNSKAQITDKDKRRLEKAAEKDAFGLNMLVKPMSICKQLNEAYRQRLEAEVKQLTNGQVEPT